MSASLLDCIVFSMAALFVYTSFAVNYLYASMQNFRDFFVVYLFFSKSTFSNNFLRNTIRVSTFYQSPFILTALSHVA